MEENARMQERDRDRLPSNSTAKNIVNKQVHRHNKPAYQDGRSSTTTTFINKNQRNKQTDEPVAGLVEALAKLAAQAAVQQAVAFVGNANEPTKTTQRHYREN
jgi:hypothetical protein